MQPNRISSHQFLVYILLLHLVESKEKEHPFAIRTWGQKNGLSIGNRLDEKSFPSFTLTPLECSIRCNVVTCKILFFCIFHLYNNVKVRFYGTHST